jgi:hypothetical protein
MSRKRIDFRADVNRNWRLGSGRARMRKKELQKRRKCSKRSGIERTEEAFCFPSVFSFPSEFKFTVVVCSPDVPWLRKREVILSVVLGSDDR